MSNTKPISLCHWGAFSATIDDARLVAAEPWANGGADADMIGAWPDLVYSEQRISQPHIRKGWLDGRSRSDGTGRGQEAMVPVDWDTALDLVANELTRVRNQYGHASIFGGSYGWSSAGRLHHARTQLRRFLGAFGGYTDQIGNYSWGAAQTLLPHVLGDFSAVSHAATCWQSISGNTDVLLAFGGLHPKNWHVTSGGAGNHHMPDHVRSAAEAGTRFVIISPMADDCPPGIAADHIALRPNTDTALILALCHQLCASGRADQAFLDRFTKGSKRFRAYLFGDDGVEKSPDWAASICGVSAAEIETLAELISVGRIMVTGSWSLQRAERGEQPFWAIIALAALLGQIGQPGGGFTFGYGSMNAVGEGARRGYIPEVSKLTNPAKSAIPVARLVDALESPGQTIAFDGREITYPDLRLIYWAGGNPFHHVQDLFRLRRAWARPETIIVHEPWWTATARHADIVLPATTSAERNDIGGSSRDPHVFFMPKLIDPVGGARNDRDSLGDLAERLNCVDGFLEGRDEEDWLRHLWSQTLRFAEKDGVTLPDFAGLKERNIVTIPRPDCPEVYLKGYRDGPTWHPLKTPSGKIEIWSESLERRNVTDLAPGPVWVSPAEWLGRADSDQLALLTRQPAKFLHGQLAQIDRLRRDDPASILIGPDDAEAREIKDGDQVRVWSDRGACLATARITTDCRRGVVAMETGPWFTPSSDQDLDLAGNPNAVTADVPTSPLAQACAAQSCLVRIEPWKGRA